MAEFLLICGVGIFVVFFFGFCVFIHELGHFLAAKWRGLYIAAFSIGFKKIWGFKYGGVEYRIGCIPCGGYVDIPQIDATGEPKTEEGEPLPRAKPADRIFTAFAGPLFNILFGFLLGTVIWIWGIPQDTPKMNSITVGYIEEKSPEYQAGLRKNDRIVTFNGQRFYVTWNEFVRKVLFSVGDVELGVKRDESNLFVRYRPTENPEMMPQEKLAYPFFRPRIPVILYPSAGSIAEKAGIKAGDEVVQVDGKDVLSHEDFIKLMEMESGGRPLNITILRNGQKVQINNIIPIPVEKDKGVFRIGVIFSAKLPIAVIDIVKGSPADSAGLRRGDFLTAINGKPIDEAAFFQQSIIESNGNPITLRIKRENNYLDKTLTPKLHKFYTIATQFVFVNHPNPWEQFTTVIDMSYKTLRGLFSKNSTIKAKHLSGPIGIFRAIGITVYRGSIMQGLNLIVMITFSLGLLNLFPIPVLDGGHICLALFEMVAKRPLPAKLVQPVTIVFIALLISFMLFISFFDSARVYYDFFGDTGKALTETTSGKTKQLPVKQELKENDKAPQSPKN
ncbi:MAG: hypothetical protein A2017_17295 [Lentisphaerae bacterium GWF2_44_16]|nr:MAG: hypothetical protein A2017_17295 [Lentisphaerae bacterium GWF2_44_16]